MTKSARRPPGSPFRYCPSCASEKIRFEQNKVFRCPLCGFTYYHNTAAATACIIGTNQGILFLVRGKEPEKGKLDLPGGFVDPGEGVFDGLRRELREELGWPPDEGLPAPESAGRCGAEPRRGGSGKAPQGLWSEGGTPPLRLFASFPNVYPYKSIVYNTCDLFFCLDAPELTEKDLNLQKSEIEGLRFIKPANIRMDDLAFESVKKAVRAYLDTVSSF